MINQNILLVTMITLLIWLDHSSAQDEELQTKPTASPSSVFSESPSNITALQGDQVILKCKVNTTILHNCQWFYLERNLDMFDPQITPKLVKQFTPAKKQDCSIKFKKVKLVQDGQWICKGLRGDTKEYAISQPAFLEVLKSSDSMPSNDNEDHPGVGAETGKPKESRKTQIFPISEEVQLVNVKSGNDALLPCNANKALESCSWIRPDGTKLPLFADLTGTYEINGNLSDGNCSLLVHKVNDGDEGNWRCVVSVSDGGDKLGPTIHLHIMDLGPHHNGVSDGQDDFSSSSLVAILVATSLLLLFIIIILVVFMYRKRVWRKEPTHRYLEPSQVTSSEYALYGPAWTPAIQTKDQRLMDDETSNHNSARYLDMTGNPSSPAENYIMFPASSHRTSSMSSKITLPDIPIGSQGNLSHRSIHSSQKSLSRFSHRSANGSQKSLPQIDNHLLRKEDLERTLSGNSDYESHLYEEIPANKNLFPNELPQYANVSESTESIPDNWASNPTYSQSESPQLKPQSNSETDSYDAPPIPPVPVRNESVNNPLANYDVPSNSMKCLNTIPL